MLAAGVADPAEFTDGRLACADRACADRASADRAAFSRASMSSSTSSVSLTPPRPKNLIPLSLAGLWLAEMTTLKLASRAPVR